MQRTTIKQLYRQTEEFGGRQVTLCGWVKTLRDSKAFGFIELTTAAFQKLPDRVRARNALQLRRNRPPERGRQPRGDGHAGAHAGKPPALRGQGGKDRGDGRFLARLSPAKKAAFDGVFARDRLPASPHQHLQRRVPHPQRGGVRHPQILQRARLRVRAHPHFDGQRLRGRGRHVPGDHPRLRKNQGRSRL